MFFTALSLHEPMSKKQKYVFVTSFLPVIVSFFFFYLRISLVEKENVWDIQGYMRLCDR